MKNDNLPLFKSACLEYLSTLSLEALRSYGRYMQLPSPTTMKKAEIAKGIVAVLCGEAEPKRKKQGAPVKNVYVDPVILNTVADLKTQYLNKPEVSVGFTRETEPESESAEILLKLSVRYSALSKRQKHLLNAFLESL